MVHKYWLQTENDRNVRHGQVFIDLLHRAFGPEEVIMVGHHFVFEPKDSMQALDLANLNEIPSADTLIFDHDIMGAVFGERAIPIMGQLAAVPAERREEILARELGR